MIIGLLATGCDNDSKRTPNGDITLGVPENVSVTVTGITMTITWDEADKALGYEIFTTSEGCNSGNRTINTKNNTAVVTSTGAAATNVTIAQNSISITLMASSGDPNIPMANAVTAKVKSIGGAVSGKQYVNSDYSEVKKYDIRIILCPPENVKITVVGRVMTVTWDTEDNAFGYEVVTTSVGCGSGNRTINTKDNTAVITSTGAAATNVIIGQKSISITLMASSGNSNIPMASAVTAKAKSIGGTASGKKYVTSDYSEVISKTIEK
jgi:hypothetical protein